MGRSKKAGGGASQSELKPFCYFCDRTFNDEIVLLQHQRGKHFRCQECHAGEIRGKCESIQGLIVHTLKVHGKTLPKVPNAMHGRDNPSSNVFGMDGIPESILEEKGYPLPGIPDPKDNQVPPVPTATPSAPSAPSAASTGMPALAPIAGMPGLPPLPGIGAPTGGVQDFLDFLGKQTQPSAPSAPCAAPLPVASATLPLTPGEALPQPGLSMGMPPAGNAPNVMMGMQCAGNGFQQHLVPGLPGLGMVPGAGPSIPTQVLPAQGVKRRLGTFEEIDDEDVSVEELRARLDRYRLIAA